jgi:hypothetical protein
MFYKIFFLVILYLFYIYFTNNKKKLIGGNEIKEYNELDKEIEIIDIDTCVDEVLRLNQLDKLCEDDERFGEAIDFCQKINFKNNKDLKKLKNSIDSGLFYEIRQEEIKQCPKEPWVTTKEECLNAVETKMKTGFVCEDDKYYKLAITACENSSEDKIRNMGKKDGILYKLLERIYKQKINKCNNKIYSCSKLNNEECENDYFKNRCKLKNNKCKPWFFSNIEECNDFLSTVKLPKVEENKILNLVQENNIYKANYLTEIYLQKILKLPFPKKNCKDQVKYLSNLKSLTSNKTKSLNKLCKTKKGKKKVNNLIWSMVTKA